MEQSEKQDFSCPACGAKLEYAPGTQSLSCPYCGTKVDIATGFGTPSSTNDSRFVVPMTIDKQKLQNAAYKYMFSQEDAPDDILDFATFTQAKLKYVPCYVFDGHYQAVWTASFGYDRTESYMVNGKIRSRTVTDWRPANGQDMGDFTVMSYAGEQLPGNVMSLVESAMGLDNMKNFDPAYTINADVAEFTATSEEIYEKDGQNKVNAVIEQGVYKHAQGDRQRDWRWKSDVQKESIPILVPVGQFTFEYKGNEYNVWCDGTDDDHFTGDPLPVDSDRNRKLLMGHIPWIGTVIGAVVGYFMFKEKFTWWVFVLPIVLMLLYWFARRSSIKGYSKKLKQRSLTNYQISNNISTEDAATISENLKRPDKPFLLSMTAFDWAILPALPLICFGVSCGLQQAFPSKPSVRQARPAATPKTDSSVSNLNAGNGSTGMAALQSKLQQAQRENQEANKRFTEVWQQVPAATQSQIASKVKNAGNQIEQTCTKAAQKSDNETLQQITYFSCTTQQLRRLTDEVQKFAQ